MLESSTTDVYGSDFFTTLKIGMDPVHGTVCHDQDTSRSRMGVGLPNVMTHNRLARYNITRGMSWISITLLLLIQKFTGIPHTLHFIVLQQGSATNLLKTSNHRLNILGDFLDAQASSPDPRQTYNSIFISTD